MCNLADFLGCLKDNGDILSLVGGTILSSILSSYFMIIFLTQLAKTGNLEINSLVLGTNKEKNLFFIAIKETPQTYDGCYIFDDQN
jgi:hypothetical protein